ncbi:hypothetical protein B0H10DRAFT_1957894 [Mycena sp. CBHHK59/15]|nr:hypothetical protein B0H10DRAFT_1957894 [Mycena sp. CBHHK59/15]
MRSISVDRLGRVAQNTGGAESPKTARRRRGAQRRQRKRPARRCGGAERREYGGGSEEESRDGERAGQRRQRRRESRAAAAERGSEAARRRGAGWRRRRAERGRREQGGGDGQSAKQGSGSGGRAASRTQRAWRMGVTTAIRWLVADGLADSLNLAKQRKISWINDICIVLSKLPIPVYWDLSHRHAITEKTVDGLLNSLKYSMEESIQAEIMSYSKTRDLFAEQLEVVEKKLVRKVLCFRSYLRVTNEKYRRALTHILLSGHALASERMTWGECYRPEPVPEQWRLCRFCKVAVEDPVHALLAFFEQLFNVLPDLKGKYTDPGLFFRDLISRRKTIVLLAKFTYDVLEIFYSTPMLIINPGIYRTAA